MSATMRRLRLTWAEEQVLRRIAQAAPDGGRVVVSALADKAHVSRSAAINALRKAAVGGVVEARNLGSKGTHIAVLDADAWAEIGRSA